MYIKGMNYILLIAIFLLGQQALAQEQTPAATDAEWKTFKTSFEARDWETFNNLHTDDVLRITPDGIRIGQEYRESNQRSFQHPDAKQCIIDFAFEHRLFRDSVAYEVGFYRLHYLAEGEISETHYGRFHVRWNKVEGQWRIAQDWDCDGIGGTKFGAAEFDKAEFLDLQD